MGIYIPGMEMPKSCWDCYFQDCGNCRLNGHKVVDKCIIEDRIDDDCPLVNVPPHGRLGDLDALKAKAIERSEKCGDLVNVLDKVITAYDIKTAPTVIPAEEAQP